MASRSALLLLGSSAFAVLAVLLAVLQPLAGLRSDFSIFNTQWNGASGLAGDLHDRGALEAAYGIGAPTHQADVAYRRLDVTGRAPGATTVFMVGPDARPDAQELTGLADFVRGGGRLVLADDFGAGNDVLQGLAATLRFAHTPLKDLSYSRGPEFVVTDRIEPSPLTAGVGVLVFDAPTALLVPADAAASPGVTVLVRSSDGAWLDANGDSVRQATEPTGSQPLLATEQVGLGEVAVLADPSILVNGMAGVGDDARLRGDLVDWATEGGRAIVWDEAHRGYPDPLRAADAALDRLPAPVTAALGILAAAFAVGLLTGRLDRRGARRLRAALAARLAPPEETADPVALALRRDPSLDESTLRSILVDWRERS